MVFEIIFWHHDIVIPLHVAVEEEVIPSSEM